MKFLRFLGVVISALILPIIAFAQNDVSSTPLTAPKVYVSNLVLDKNTVFEGDTLTGQVTLFNSGNSPSSDVYYNIILTSHFVDRVPQIMYDQVTQGPVSLGVGEKKTVKFTYKVPKGFAYDDMGIRIQAILKTGIKMGWADTHLTISGTNPQLFAKSSSLNIQGKIYSPESGPTVMTGDSIAYNVTLINDGLQIVKLTPHITVYKYGSFDEVVSQVNGEPVNIGIGESKIVSVPLPKMNYMAGVYHGKLTFSDEREEVKSQIMTFRYIIGEEIATIQSIVADRTSVLPGDKINATVTFTGAPRNIDTDRRADLGDVTLVLTAQDKDGMEVGSTIQNVKASDSMQSVAVIIPVTKSAASLKFNAVLKKGDKILSTYSSNVQANRALPLDFKTTDYSVFQFAFIFGLIVILLYVGIYILARSRKYKKMPPHITGLGASLMLLLVLAGLYGVSSGVLKAFFYQSSSPLTFRPLFINLPSDNQQLAKNQTFFLEGAAIFSECDNKDYGPHLLTVVYNGNTSTFVTGAASPSTASSSPYTLDVPINEQFSVGPFTAPATLGTKRMTITYSVFESYVGMYPATNTETVYVDTNIVDTPATSSISQSSSFGSTPCGGYAALYWGAVNQATEYRLYRDNVLIYTGTNLSYVDQVKPNTAHSYYVSAVINNVSQPPSNAININSSAYCPLSIGLVEALPTPAVVGQKISWVVWATGGSGFYTYSWSGDDGLNDNSGRIVTKTYSTTGKKSGTVTVRSTDNQVTSSTTYVDIFSSNGYSGITCSASPANPVVGQPVTWTVTTVPPSGSYAYVWGGSDGLYGTTQNVQKTYTTMGVKHAQVDIVGVGTYNDCFADVNVQWKSSFREI